MDRFIVEDSLKQPKGVKICPKGVNLLFYWGRKWKKAQTITTSMQEIQHTARIHPTYARIYGTSLETYAGIQSRKKTVFLPVSSS